MKRQRKGLAAFLAYMTVVSLVTGCGADGEAVSGEAEEALQQEETDVTTADESAEAPEETETINTDSGMEEEADGKAGAEESGSWPFSPVRIENPGGAYYFEGDKEKENPQTITLLNLTCSANEITDEEDWFADNSLTRPGFPYEDENYRYEVAGEDGFNVYLLTLYDKKKDGANVTLDFSDYRYARDFADGDNSLLFQRICYARAVDGILYVSTAHNTYSESAPNTAYVTAIDLSDFHVIWKTAPLTNNAHSFEIIGGALVCGYGFTGEDDYLNIIDRSNGKLWEQIPLKTMAYDIIRQEDILYVRTYDTDYQFTIKMLDSVVEGGSVKDTDEDSGQEVSEFMKQYDGSYEVEETLRGTKIRYRMIVMDAALGSRLYGLLKSTDDGETWREVSLDPFDSQSGGSIAFTFLTEDFGFATLSHNGGDSAILYVTEDGGKHYTESTIEEQYVTLPDGTMYVPYDFPRMPYMEEGKLYVLCGQGADGDYAGGDSAALARFKSEDNGHSFLFDRMVPFVH